MAESRWERLAPLSGVAFFVLIVASVALSSIGTPSDFPGDPDEIVEYYEDQASTVIAGVWLGLLASVALLWFAGALRARLRVAEGGEGRVSAIAFGGGVAAATVEAVADAVNLAAALRADEEGTIDAGAATALYDFESSIVGVALPMAFIVLVGATAVVALRTGVLPRWLGIASILLAVALLVLPIAWAVTGVAVLWILVVSVLLYMTGPPAAVPTTPQAKTGAPG